jgi:hypothetical protein
MGKASWRTPSLVALALLVALLAAAMEHSLAATAEEEGSAAPAVADADAPEADAPAVADEDTTGGGGGGDGAPAPVPASEEPSHKTTIGAKAKAGLHTVMAGISKGKNKLECKVLGRHCPTSEAPSAQ